MNVMPIPNLPKKVQQPIGSRRYGPKMAAYGSMDAIPFKHGPKQVGISVSV